MKRRFHSTPNSTVPMRPFCVSRQTKTFRNDAPLQCKVLIVIERHTLIRTPAHRTMVYNDILTIPSSKSIRSIGTDAFFLISHAETQKTYYHIIHIISQRNRPASQTNAITRCGLSGNSQITLSDFQLFL